MGIATTENKVKEFLRKDVSNKNELELILKDDSVNCWWFCDSDLEGLTIYHKYHSGEYLIDKLREKIQNHIDLPVKVYYD